MHEELSAPTTVHQSFSPKGGSGDPASNAHWERLPCWKTNFYLYSYHDNSMRQFHTTTFYFKMIPSYLNRALDIRAFHQRTNRRLRSSELTGIVSFEYLTSTYLSSALKNLTHQGTNHRGIYFVLSILEYISSVSLVIRAAILDPYTFSQSSWRSNGLGHQQVEWVFFPFTTQAKYTLFE